MIEYNLADVDGNIFELNGLAVPIIARNTMTIESENFTFETRAENNSFLAGKIKIGDNRLESRILPLQFDYAFVDDSTFNTNMNTMILHLNKVLYLIDVTNSKRMLVNIVNFLIPKDNGSFKRLGAVSFNLDCLNPYWEDNTELELTTTTVADTLKDIAFNNNGYIELYPKFEIISSDICAYVEFILGVESIRIEDSIFGSVNYESMLIDNEEGFVSIGVTDRTQSVISGLGFISIPVGSNTLQVVTDVICAITIKYRRRYYV